MKQDLFTALAQASGFETVAALDVATLRFLPEVREMCRADRCRRFGRSWSCPPACGTLDELRERAGAYDTGLLLQTVGLREDAWDWEGIRAAEENNARRFDALTAGLRAAGLDFFAMSAGSCHRCGTCSCPDAPCRHPESLYPSVEACGLLVSELCRDNGVDYHYGDERIAFTCAVLYHKEEKWNGT